jgi:hypothetical protein
LKQRKKKSNEKSVIRKIYMILIRLLLMKQYQNITKKIMNFIADYIEVTSKSF